MNSRKLIVFACLGVLGAIAPQVKAGTYVVKPLDSPNLPLMLLFGLLSFGTAVLLRRANSKEK